MAISKYFFLPNLQLLIAWLFIFQRTNLKFMNWRKTDECWKSFASERHLVLDQSERNFFYGSQTKYKLILPRQNYSLTFYGDMKRSSEGYSRYHTTLFIKNLNCNTLDFDEVSNSRFLLIFKNKYRDPLKANLLELIRMYNAKKIIRTDFGFEIRYDYLFGKSKDFYDGIKLADEIERRASGQHAV